MNRPFAESRIDYVINLAEPSKKDRILNIGIANIPEIEMSLERKAKECWTIDIDKKKLENARRYLKKTKLMNADILKDNFKKKYFDKVIVLEVLEHLDDDNLAVKRINQIMKLNGKIIISVPNKNILHLLNPVRYIEHKRHYSNAEITKLLEANGFRIEHFNIVENWKLLANLYLHIFFKFIIGKSRQFNRLDKKNSTYSRINKNGLDIIIRAVKIRDA